MTTHHGTAVTAVLADVLDGLPTARPVTTRIREAGGLVCARDVVAPSALPPEDRAAMDGVAVRAEDLIGASRTAPVRLHLDGATLAGRGDMRPLQPSTAREIATGAPLPPGADAIVRVEELHRDASAVTVTAPVAPGRDIRPAGEDAPAGHPLVTAGRVLDTGALGGMAGAGVDAVEVIPAPRIAVLPTGDEVVGGTTPDAVGPALVHLLARDGAVVTLASPVVDELDVLDRTVRSLASDHDVVVTVGGVSVGARDHVGSLVAGLAIGRHVSLAMRPGRPFAWGRTADGTTVLCLPGTPVAALAAAVLLVRPVVARLGGRPAPLPVSVPLGAPVQGDSRRRSLLPASMANGLVRPVGGHGAANLARLAAMSAMIDLPPDTGRLDAGATVDVWPLP